MTVLNAYLWGAFTMGALAAAIFFFRFYRDTHDRLFLIFGLAFCFLGLDRFALALFTENDENRHYIYLLRLTAFLLIIIGIIDKNRAREK